MRIGSGGDRAQVAFEFLIVYSFVLIIFILLFSIIATQRAAALGQQQYSLLQIQSQNIAGYIDQAVIAGTGYSATVPLAAGLMNSYYNLSISSTGVVIAKTTVGGQQMISYGFSDARSVVVNGTLQTSANGISIYQVPTYRGSIMISNLEGTIYIDKTPPPISSLAQAAVVTEPANVKTMLFDSVSKKDYVSVNNSVKLGSGNPESVYFWVYADGCGSVLSQPDSIQLIIDVVSSCSPGIHSDKIYFNYTDAQGRHTLSVNAPSMHWINLVATYNTASGMTLYLNGTQAASASVSGSGPVPSSSNILIGNGDALFNGSIANLQIYNSILSPSQVSRLFINGLGSMPINSSLVGWWPLDGNPNDYSGFGNYGVPINGPKYGSVIQLNAQVYSISGNFLANSLVGFVGSKGYLSGNGPYSSSYTNGHGFSSAFVTSSGTYGSGNVIVDLFKANATALMGWWPLDTGYGVNVFDLSQGSDTGNFIKGYWTQYVNQTNFIAPDYPKCASGAGCSGPHAWVVSVNSSQPSLFNIVNNGTVTVTAWIYPVPGGQSDQGVIGNWNSNNGFQLIARGASQCPVFYVANSPVYIPNCNIFPNNNWTMITAQYDGNTGAATVYMNDTVIAHATLSQNLSLGINSTPYEIGFDTRNPNPLSNFDGLISNIQLYDLYLTPQQIGSLYGSGLTAAPLENSGLVAWWPMINNPASNTIIDYSSNNNTGIENSSATCPPGHIKQGVCSNSITYINAAYNNTNQQAGTEYATFNGFSYVKIPYTAKLASASNALAVSFWFASFNRYSSNVDQSLASVTTSAGASAGYLNISLCASGSSCSPVGIEGHFGSSNVNASLNFAKNTWYEVTETFNSSVWSVYIDGNKVNGGVYPSFPASPSTTGYIYLGSGPGAANFTGQMADFQIYNSMLTSQQAMQIYLQGLPAQYTANISVG